MDSRKLGPAPPLRPLSDAEFYALSEREKLSYLTCMLLELDRLNLRWQREREAEDAAPQSDGTPH